MKQLFISHARKNAILCPNIPDITDLFNGLFSDMNNEIYYYEDQSLFNPIHTSPLDINQYLESSADEWEIFEYQTSVNNRSVKIRSFQPSQDNTQEFLFNVDQNNDLVLTYYSNLDVRSFFRNFFTKIYTPFLN